MRGDGTLERVALVTGASGAIGCEIFNRFSEIGVSVFGMDMETFGDDRIYQGNVTCPEDWANTISNIMGECGRIDILVNNAGVSGPVSYCWDMPIEAWDHVLAVNLTGTFIGCQSVLPVMRVQKYGRIVNIASTAGKIGNAKMSAYCASKAGVIGLTKALAQEVAQEGVLINCVCPALIDGGMSTKFDSETEGLLLRHIPMGRPGTPKEVALLVEWLSSDACSFSTGSAYDLSGGRAPF